MIDIVIPHFNGANLIGKLLNSIKFERWINVYIVDDHSDKAQFEALSNLCQNYPSVKLLKVPKGQKGPGMARNVGIENSNGKWLFFADADDFFTDNAFEMLYRYLDSQSDLVFFPHTSIIQETGEVGTRHKFYKELINEYCKTGDKKLFYKFYSPCSKLVSRKLIEPHAIKFDDGIGGEDNNFSLKCSYYAKEIEVSKDPVYCIVESQSSMTASYSKQVLINHFNAMSRFNDFLQKNNQHSYQAPMLGWIVKGRQISIATSFKWLWISLKKGYPVSPFHYLKVGSDS